MLKSFKGKVLTTGIAVIFILLINLELFPINTYRLFYLYSSMGEDAAQLLNSISISHQHSDLSSVLTKSLFSPFIDLLGYFTSSISKLLFSTEIQSIIFVTVLIYILPIVVINLILFLQVPQANYLELISKILLILTVNILISTSILVGHANLLYCLALSYLALINQHKHIVSGVLYSLAILSWYPSVILFALLIIRPVMINIIKDVRAAASDLSNYVILILFTATISVVYIFIQVSAKNSDWKFDLLREQGGSQSISSLNVLLILVALSSLYILNEKYNTNLNFLSIYLILISYIFFVLYNVFFVATSTSYGINKLTTLLFISLTFFVITYYIRIHKKISIKFFSRVLMPLIFILFLFPSKDLDSFISLYSKSNAPSFSGVNKTQFNDFAKLIGSDFNYFVIRDSYTVSQNINSYLTSRWVSSLLGRDDRKLDGQLGWRFVLLNRIDDQDFFCCFEKGKGIFILFDDEISTVISVEKVKSMLLKDS